MQRLSDVQWERIREHFPEENLPDDRPGGKPITSRNVLDGVPWILIQQWRRNDVLRNILTDLANTLRDEGAVDERECCIDAMFQSAKGGGDDNGKTKRGKGVKIIAIVDRHGLPLAVSTHAANHREVTLVQLSVDFYMIEAKPENLIGDRAYDSDPLDKRLRQQGIEMISPHKSHRMKKKTQDRRRLRRWIVERIFAWLQWQRRLLVPWEYYSANFLGVVQLASISHPT
jgi:transposase